MVSGIGSIGSFGSSFAVSSVQSKLTQKTKAELEALGIDTSNIKSEEEGQALLQSAQSTQQGQETQQSQKSQKSGGNHAAFESLRQEAVKLAEKVGVSVSSTDKLSDIMDAISQAITDMQAQAANDPQKAAQVAQYQAEYESISQQIQSLEQSKPSSSSESGTSQLQASMAGLAAYNMASISITNSNADHSNTAKRH